MKIKNILLSIFIAIIIIPFSGIVTYADSGENLTVIEMISPEIVPGSSKIPIEIKVDYQGQSKLEEFMEVDLEIIWNTGVNQRYKMNDFGSNGDAVQGDGIFTSLISTDTSLGEHKVIAYIKWRDNLKSYPAEFKIITQQFPAVFLISGVDFIGYEELENTIGFLRTEVSGTPFEVDIENLNITLTDLQGNPLKASIISKNKPNKDYEFFIYSSIPLEDGFKISANLEMEFLNVPFKSPMQEVTVYKSVENIGLLTLISLTMLIIISLIVVCYILIIHIKKVPPHGFILDSERKFITDFSDIDRGIMSKLIFRNSLSSKELKNFGIDGIKLKFFKEYILLEVEDGVADTLRVDGKPVNKSKSIQSEVSVGSNGKLFYLSKSDKQLEFPVKISLSGEMT